MKLQKSILLGLISVWLTNFTVLTASVSENYISGLTIKSKPKTAKTKRLRLTDEVSDKAWKGAIGKNTLKIDLGSERRINRVRLLIKNAIQLELIRLKGGTSESNLSVLEEQSNVGVSDGEWIELDGFESTIRYLRIKTKSDSRIKVLEVEVNELAAQDVNRDGVSDFIIGGYGYFNGVIYSGRAQVYLGSSQLAITSSLSLFGDEDQCSFGSSVSIIGDVNNDGFDDFIVTAYTHDAAAGPGANRGRAYVYLGGSSLSSTPMSPPLSGDEDAAFYGYPAVGIGDINNDGFADFMIGASLHDAGGSNRGRAYVYLGGISLNSAPILTLSGDDDGAAFGYSIAGIGDVNSDGFDDFMVGAYTHDAGGSERGRAYVYLGGSTLSNTPVLTISGDENGAGFGISVAGIGDVNSDGFDDFMVGASTHDAAAGPGANRGRAYVYLGGSSLSSTPMSPPLSGDENTALFGLPVTGIGDVNNDGYGDVLVSAYGHDQGGPVFANRGRAYVYLGNGSSLNSIPALTLSGDEDSASFGFSAAGVGDVNNDGFDDYIVGAVVHDAGGSDRGRSYLYLGNSSAGSETFTFSGDTNSEFFGSSID